MAIVDRPPKLPRHLSRLGSDLLRAGESRARVRFLPDGTLLGVANDLRQWDIDLGLHLTTMSGDSERFGAFCPSPNGELVAVVDELGADVIVFSLEDGREVHRLSHELAPGFVAWSPEGSLIATGGGEREKQVGKTVHLWDASTGAEENQLKANKGAVAGIVFSADGEMLAAGGDRSTKVWELRRASDGALKRLGKPRVFKHEEPVWRLLFSPHRDLLLSSTAHTVTCWELETGASRWTVTRPGYAQFACLRWSAELLLTAFGDTMLLIDPTSGDVVEQWPGIWGGVADMDVSPGGDVVAASGSFTTRVQLFELPTGRQRPEPTGAAGWMQDIVPSPDRTSAVTCSWDGQALYWERDQADMRLRRIFELRDGTRRVRCKAACFLPDGDIVVGYESHLQRWGVGEDSPRWERSFAHGWSLTLITSTADGRVVVCCDEASRRTYGHATFYDAENGEVLASRRLYWTIRRAVANEKHILLVGSKGAITVDSSSLEFSKETPYSGRWPSTLGALSPDGRLWVGRAGDIVSDVAKWSVLETQTGELVRELDLESEPVDMDFGLEGRVLVTAHAEERSLRFWDPLAGTLLQEFDLAPIVPHRIRCVGEHVIISERRGELVATRLPDLSYTVPTKPKKIDYITACQRALQAEPSPESWQVLCAAFDRWKELPDRMLEEAATVLEGWPDELRVAPDRWLDEVIEGRHQPRLRLVRILRYSQVLASGAINISRSHDLDGLIEIELAMGPIGPDAAKVITERFPDLKALKLYAQRIGDAGAKAIAAAPWTRLEVLRLGANTIRDAGAVALVTSPNLSSLMDLSLESNNFSQAAFETALTSATHLAGLERLNLSGTKIRGVKAITEAKHLTKLRSLVLSWLELGDDDLERLASAPHLEGLRTLVLKGCKLSLEAIGILADASFTSTLEVLDVEFAEDAYTVEQALAGYPNIEEVYDNRLRLDIEELM